MDILIKVPREICSTGVPSYKCARIPIMSGLNVEKWQSYLSGCPDDRLINYIRFGFPLSLNSTALHYSLAWTFLMTAGLTLHTIDIV